MRLNGKVSYGCLRFFDSLFLSIAFVLITSAAVSAQTNVKFLHAASGGELSAKQLNQCYLSSDRPTSRLTSANFSKLTMINPEGCNGGQVCPRIDPNTGLSFLDCDDRAWLYCLNMPTGTCWQVTYFGHWSDVRGKWIGHVIVVVRRQLPDGRYQYCAVDPEGDTTLGCFEPCDSADANDCYNEERLKAMLCRGSSPVGTLDCSLPVEIYPLRPGTDLSACYGGPDDQGIPETPWWQCGIYQRLLNMCVAFEPSSGPRLECLPPGLRSIVSDCEDLVDSEIFGCNSGDTTLCNASDPFDPTQPRMLRPLYCCPDYSSEGFGGRWDWAPEACN